jgi:hypothetical protein
MFKELREKRSSDVQGMKGEKEEVVMFKELRGKKK